MPPLPEGWRIQCEVVATEINVWCARAELSFRGEIRTRLVIAGPFGSPEKARQALDLRVQHAVAELQDRNSGDAIGGPDPPMN